MATKTDPAADAGPKLVNVRVLPKGDGLISKGDDADIGARFAKGDVFQVAAEIGQDLEDAGLAEVQA